jgi:RNA polymerase sigma-70 factor (ECF subfamily)
MQSEKSAFGDLVDTYQTRVFQVALSILGDKDEALNITQEVFMKAFRSYEGFRFDASPETWLVRITINKVRDHIRKERLRRLVFVKSGAFSDREINAMADEHQSPEAMLSEKQFRASVKAFQRGLKGRENEVFALRFGNGYTIKEISKTTGLSQSSVKTYLYRALGKAQKHLAEWRNP